MDEQDFVRLLQIFRHDLMNDLQLLAGYMSISDLDKAEKKLNHIIANIQKERFLISLHTPKLFIWIMQNKHLYPNISITYELNVQNENLSHLDDLLVNKCTKIVDTVKQYGNEKELYNINLNFLKEKERIKFILQIHGSFKSKCEVMDSLKKACPHSTFTFENSEITSEYVYLMEK